MEIKNRKFSFSRMLEKEREKDWNAFTTMHPKQVLCSNYPTDSSNNSNSEFRGICKIGKVDFNYVTKHGKATKDIRIFILNYEANEEDIKNEFEKWIVEYNDKYSYRALLNHEINSISIFDLNNKKILSELKELDIKSKNRIIINKCHENNIIIFQVKTEYISDRQKRKESVFALPMLTSNVQVNLNDKYVSDIVNNNRQRKVLNVKILSTKALALIGV